MTDGHHFNNILLGGRGGTNPGQLRVHAGGIAWRKQGGGKIIEVDKADIASLTWMKVPTAYQLGGLTSDVFIWVLRGLSGAKVTRVGSFRSCQGGYAVKSSLKAEDGLLYPLEKGFFFLPKPPTLILQEEIEYVEFERHGAGGLNVSSHYFDLLVKLKNDREHLFRNIQSSECHNLFDFISGKGLKIMNLGDVQTTNGVAAVLQNADDDAVDPHLERIKNEAGGEESDEEDEDFVADKDNGGSPTDESEEEESNARESGHDKEMIYADKTEVYLNLPIQRSAAKDSEKEAAAEEKDPFEAMARADAKRYKEAMAGYKSGGPASTGGPSITTVDSGNETE
ncbi:putative FACT complex subunit SSRP1 [Cocos nucifera]|uniref:FACT complex subunit SSRP1 n=1 Tax=Cocos nucifera TaxID=13894 RepID=A0A8K0I423_COCNU|nr:putative FACT complex subunit SSRP1 [Cocos nucifera]